MMGLGKGNSQQKHGNFWYQFVRFPCGAPIEHFHAWNHCRLIDSVLGSQGPMVGMRFFGSTLKSEKSLHGDGARETHARMSQEVSKWLVNEL